MVRIAITSASFSKEDTLVEQLRKKFDHIKSNPSGKVLYENDLIPFLENTDAAIIGLDQITLKVLDACPRLKFISKYGVGLDNIDQTACEKKGVKIGWSGGINKRSVSEMALGFMISLCRNLYTTSQELSHGNWIKNGGYQLTDKTVGIIGVGNIGKDLISLLKPFNCTILANDIIDQTDYYNKHHITHVDKETLFKKADIVSIHTPLTPETTHLIHAKTLSLMHPNSCVINTARGGIVNLKDLKKALIDNQIKGAALDVYEKEPPSDLELLGLHNLFCTPHIGGNARESILAMGNSAIKHLCTFYQV